MSKTKLSIEYVPLNELIKWPRNPKSHDIGQLHGLMNRFGFTAPVLVDEKTGRLVAGHGRLETLIQKMNAGEDPPERIIKGKDKIWQIPVVRGISFNSEGEAEAYLLADNKSVEIGGWDEYQLAEVFKAMIEDDPELLLGLGWDDDEIDSIVKAGNLDTTSIDGNEDTAPSENIVIRLEIGPSVWAMSSKEIAETLDVMKKRYKKFEYQVRE